MKKRIAIIGAGFGGLAASIRLAAAGCAVDLFEKNEITGGKAYSLQQDAFRFDTGPTIVTIPAVIRELFADADENIDDYLSFHELEIFCKYFFPDQSTLIAYADPQRFAREIENKLVDSKESFLSFYRYTQKLYELSDAVFLRQSIHDWRTLLKPATFSALMSSHKLDIFRSMHRSHQAFFKDPRIIQLFDRYASFNGSHPYWTPATFNVIAYVEHGLKTCVPHGGIFALAQALTRLAEKKGVTFHLQKKVDKIATQNKRVSGIYVDGKLLPYNVVVSNADVFHTYNTLLSADSSQRQLKHYQPAALSCSAVVFYWNIKGRYPQLDVNNTLFCPDYKQEFDDIFVHKTCPKDPTVYINISARYNPADAPQGCENWFILVNAPIDKGQDWAAEMASLKLKVIERINRTLKTDITAKINAETILTPKDIERRTGSYCGSLYGLSSNNLFNAFYRQANKATHWKGLYFAGGTAHPGGGIPLCILSAKITSDLIARDEL